MTQSAAILAPLGLTLSARERDFFRDADPWGFILFARNAQAPAQLAALVADLRAVVGRDAPVLIDQEGGRVQRLRPPHWRAYMPALDQMAAARDPLRAQYIRNRLIAAELHDVGIDVNCAPLADVADDETHPVLRNRLYGHDPAIVTSAARVCAQALLDGGVLPVLKHMPGHGRARVDSHLDLPRTAASLPTLMDTDFRPFQALSDLPLGMTAHVVFEKIDPDAPATTSSRMHQIMREDIGFQGLLMTDDLSMQALSGSIRERVVAARTAGCDLILHCNGDSAEMAEVVSTCGALDAKAQMRAKQALDLRKQPDEIDIRALEAELASLIN